MLVAGDVQSMVMPNCGHQVADEAPDDTLAALTAFLAPYTSEMDGLDQRRADAAHRIDDEVAGSGVGLDGRGCDRRKHLGRMGDRRRDVPPGALGACSSLGGVVHTDSGSSAVIGKPRRAGKDSDVFMHDQMNGSSSCSGASGLGKLPEGGSGADPPSRIGPSRATTCWR
jgi:hypothetical protein